MSYSLNTTILNPLYKGKAKNAVILCHGYGGDGKDISLLASYWRTYLPETLFICPDAPERCAVSHAGFQWFDLMDQTRDQILIKSLVAEIKLNKLIDEVIKKNELKGEQIALGGFSQGCMISLQTGIKRKEKINAKNISKNLYTKEMPDPDILIRTGDTKRLSNFLLWQIAYTEIFFEKKLWPDFKKNDYRKIINNFKNVKRNFGAI